MAKIMTTELKHNYEVTVESANGELEILISFPRKSYAIRAANQFKGLPSDRNVSVYDRANEQEIFIRVL